MERWPGDLLFFRSSLIAHKAEEPKGEIMVCTLFTNGNIVTRSDRENEKRKEKKKKRAIDRNI